MKPIRQEPTPPYQLQKTDLRSITRRSDKVQTTVLIDMGDDQQFEWILFGEVEITSLRTYRADGYWMVSAPSLEGPTDLSHDAPFSLRFIAIGLQFDRVFHQETRIFAWIDSDSTDFHIPKPGYDPVAHPEAFDCTDKKCSRGKHKIVPHFLPPFDKDVFKLVSGKRIEIRIRAL